jgi:hypothetical protein
LTDRRIDFLPGRLHGSSDKINKGLGWIKGAEGGRKDGYPINCESPDSGVNGTQEKPDARRGY